MRHALTVLKMSFWLGWENESNWTKRPFYFLYAAIRPLALCVILYFLFRVVSDDPSRNPTFVSVYLGNAFFTIFMTVSGGVAWVIIEDREFFRLIKYIVIAPMNFVLYVIGRATLVLLVSIVSLMIILLVGVFFLHIPLSLGSVHWPLLLGAFVLGLVSTGALGIMTAGVVLITARHSTLLAEGIGGVFLLLCGVIYPVDLLPKAARWVSLGIPLTYWMEATRRAFDRPAFGQTLAGWSSGQLLLVLFVSAAGLALAAFAVFRLCYNFAKARGKIDQTTQY